MKKLLLFGLLVSLTLSCAWAQQESETETQEKRTKRDSILVEDYFGLGLSHDRYFSGGEPFGRFSLSFTSRISGATPRIGGRRRQFPRWVMLGFATGASEIERPNARAGSDGFFTYFAEGQLGLRVTPLIELLGKPFSISRWIDPYAYLAGGYKISEIGFTTEGQLWELSGAGAMLYVRPMLGVQTFPLDFVGFHLEVNPLNLNQFNLGIILRFAEKRARLK
jgi:hypothetical protein